MKVEYKDHCGSDLMCVDAARVSFNKESEWEQVVVSDSEYTTHRFTFLDDGWRDMTECYDAQGEFTDNNLVVLERLKPTDRGLILYLAENKHLSPFNHSFIVMRIKAPIFVARQLQKHEYMPWNEVSRRYVDDPPEFYVPEVWRGRAEDKKQGSFGEVQVWVDVAAEGARACEMYEELLQLGVCPEQARMVLPQSMYTEWFWSGTLGAWAKMYNLRSKPDTQEETRHIAMECGKIIEPLFPVAWKELTK